MWTEGGQPGSIEQYEEVFKKRRKWSSVTEMQNDKRFSFFVFEDYGLSDLCAKGKKRWKIQWGWLTDRAVFV